MRTTGAIAIGAVLLMTLASCGSAPSSSGAPSELPPIAPSATLPASPTPSIDGVALAEAAVARLQGDPFVAHVELESEITVVDAVEGSLPTGTTVKSRMVADFDGDDVGAVMTMSVPGAAATEMGFWVVGDDAWVRPWGGDLVQVGRSDVAPYVDGMLQEIRITDDPRHLRYVGPETIDGRTVHHLTVAPGTIPYTSGTFDALELYVQTDGTPVRLSGTFTGKGDAGETGTGTTTIEFTSFGGQVTIEPPTGDATSPGATAGVGSPPATADSATVDGLPGQREPWSGEARCDEQVGGPVVWITVPPEANEHWVAFDVFVSTPPDPRAIVGGRPASVTEVSGDAGSGRIAATVDHLDQCRRTRDGETPEPGAPEGYVCPYQNETATVTVTWSCPDR